MIINENKSASRGSYLVEITDQDKFNNHCLTEGIIGDLASQVLQVLANNAINVEPTDAPKGSKVMKFLKKAAINRAVGKAAFSALDMLGIGIKDIKK